MSLVSPTPSPSRWTAGSRHRALRSPAARSALLLALGLSASANCRRVRAARRSGGDRSQRRHLDRRDQNPRSLISASTRMARLPACIAIACVRGPPPMCRSTFSPPTRADRRRRLWASWCARSARAPDARRDPPQHDAELRPRRRARLQALADPRDRMGKRFEFVTLPAGGGSLAAAERRRAGGCFADGPHPPRLSSLRSLRRPSPSRGG